jgi:dipeptidyl aminopeptidase/acylaminoacyl peptidase
VKKALFLLMTIALAGCAAAPADAATPTRSATGIPVTLVATATRTTPATAVPSPTPAPTATPQPAAQFTQLTDGGCCVQPFFAGDASRVMFLDKPAPEAPAGIWAVSVDAPLSESQLVTEKLGPFSRDMAYAADLVRGQTIIERLSDGQRWTINNGGRSVSFSPDATRIVWTVQQESGGFDVRRTEIWLANIDGSQPRRVATRFGGGAIAWLPDGQSVLVGGKANRADALSTLSVLSLEDGALRDLMQFERMRSPLLSRDGRWLAYLIAQARDESQDGMYVLDVQTAGAQPRKLDFFGAYRWRDGNRLLFVPVKTGAPANELWQLDATTGESTQLIAAEAASPFKIGNGDWDVSPDGARIVFLNARDRNLWLAQLP